MILRARQFEWVLPRPVLVMGILNVTPDSFSDAGRYLDVGHAVERALEMAAEGADIVDIGGESTRPQSLPVPEDEELRRVIPVLERLAGRLAIPISIDTMKPRVAQEALSLGASIVNDVGAGLDGEDMWELVRQTGAGYVCMHMRGTPRTMQQNPVYTSVVDEVRGFFLHKFNRLRDCGVAAEQVIFDPGIGFGKTLDHNLELLGRMREFVELGRPLMIGVSRKSFIEKLLGAKAGDRLPGSLACACMAAATGVGVLRVHDVAATVQAVRMTEAILSNGK